MHPNKYDFLQNTVHRLEGWLEDYAALRSLDLLWWQEQKGVRGPLVEIGVFRGRYFSLLLESAARTGDAVLGIDTFQYVGMDQVRTEIAAGFPDAPEYAFLPVPSTDLVPSDILSALGRKKPRFISVDGSHEFEDVVWDLRLCEEILAPEGIVSVDDFINPVTFGVNQGVHAFFASSRSLVPFAYIANKLFLARPMFASVALPALEQVIMQDEHEPRSVDFRNRLKHGRAHVEQKLWGKPLLSIP